MAHHQEVTMMIKRYYLSFDMKKYVEFILDCKQEVLAYVDELKSVSDDDLKEDWKSYHVETDQKIFQLETRVRELEAKISYLENSIY